MILFLLTANLNFASKAGKSFQLPLALPQEKVREKSKINCFPHDYSTNV